MYSVGVFPILILSPSLNTQQWTIIILHMVALDAESNITSIIWSSLPLEVRLPQNMIKPDSVGVSLRASLRVLGLEHTNPNICRITLYVYRASRP